MGVCRDRNGEQTKKVIDTGQLFRRFSATLTGTCNHVRHDFVRLQQVILAEGPFFTGSTLKLRANRGFSPDYDLIRAIAGPHDVSTAVQAENTQPGGGREMNM